MDRCSFGLYVPKLYFHLNLKWHCSHWKGILFLYVCPKVVFMDKPKIAFFAFKIHTDEYILCTAVSSRNIKREHLNGKMISTLFFAYNSQNIMIFSTLQQCLGILVVLGGPPVKFALKSALSQSLAIF